MFLSHLLPMLCLSGPRWWVVLACLLSPGAVAFAQGPGSELADGRLMLSYVSVANAAPLLLSAGPALLPVTQMVWVRALPPRPTAKVVGGPVPKLPDPYRALFLRIARETRVPVALIAAVAAAESGFDPLARSPKGATGLMQLMPDTARRFNVTDLLSPEQNLRGGATYLRWLSERFANDMERVIAAYNAGENAVDKAGGMPPFQETQEYLPKVLHYLQHFDKTLGPGRPV